MTSTERAREMLPRIPDEVFELWIAPCVAKSGWPYQHVEDPGDEYWQGYFLGLPIREIAELGWTREILPFDIAMFVEEQQSFLKKMVFAHEAKIDPRVLRIAVPVDSEARYHSAKAFVQEKQAVPGAIALLRTAHGFQILDGWHRLAAVHGLQGAAQRIGLPVWIAAPAKAASQDEAGEAQQRAGG